VYTVLDVLPGSEFCVRLISKSKKNLKT